MGVSVMSKMNLKTQAYNTIRQKIVTCEYAPGTFLNEELLTTELGLSRTPVRDALSRLEPVSYTHLSSQANMTIPFFPAW